MDREEKCARKKKNLHQSIQKRKRTIHHSKRQTPKHAGPITKKRQTNIRFPQKMQKHTKSQLQQKNGKTSQTNKQQQIPQNPLPHIPPRLRFTYIPQNKRHSTRQNPARSQKSNDNTTLRRTLLPNLRHKPTRPIHNKNSSNQRRTNKPNQRWLDLHKKR
jgi:hypothetical protein